MLASLNWQNVHEIRRMSFSHSQSHLNWLLCSYLSIFNWNVGNWLKQSWQRFPTNFLYIGFFVFCCSVYLFARWFFFLSSFILVREIAMQKLLPSNKFLLMCNLIIMNLLLCSFICNSLFVCVYLSELLLICAYNINTVRIYVFHCVSNFSDFPFLRSLSLSLYRHPYLLLCVYSES